MKANATILTLGLFLLASAVAPAAHAGNGVRGESPVIAYADIYDIFLVDWTPVSVDDPDVQWFADRVPWRSDLFRKADSEGVETYIYLTRFEFGCIAKDYPSGKKMHIEDCQVSRFVRDGMADTNYTHHVVLRPDGTEFEFNSIVTWTFNLVPDSDLWLVGRSVINDNGPDLVEFYCTESEGIIGKRQAIVYW